MKIKHNEDGTVNISHYWNKITGLYEVRLQLEVKGHEDCNGCQDCWLSINESPIEVERFIKKHIQKSGTKPTN